jgi:tetratricopeptide (TPR) repeat protein
MQAGVIAFLVHMSWDWDWDMAAIGTLAFVFIAVVASYRRTTAGDLRLSAGRPCPEAEREGAEAEPEPVEAAEGTAAAETAPAVRAEARAARAESSAALPGEDDGETTREPAGESVDESEQHGRRRLRPGWGIRAVASAALVLLAVCWLPPYLAQRAENAALAEASDGRVAAGLVRARRAATLDPLAVSSLLTQATLLQQLGQNSAALAKLQEAARLQPQNFQVWYALGELQQGALGQKRQARASFTRALALNPLDAASRYELDRLGR